MNSQDEKRKRLLTPLTEEEYEKAEVPDPNDIRNALRRGSKLLRQYAAQPQPRYVDSGKRF